MFSLFAIPQIMKSRGCSTVSDINVLDASGFTGAHPSSLQGHDVDWKRDFAPWPRDGGIEA